MSSSKPAGSQLSAAELLDADLEQELLKELAEEEDEEDASLDEEEDNDSDYSAVSYAGDLWDGFGSVAARAKAGCVTLNKLAMFLRRKAALDRSYAKNLRALSQDALGADEVDGSVCGQSLKQFQNLNSVLADNYEIFAAKVLEFASKPVEQLHASVVKRSKAMVTQGTQLTRERKALEEQLEASQAECERLCKSYRAAQRASAVAIQFEKERASPSNTIRNAKQKQALHANAVKAKKKTQALCKAALASDRQYMNAVKALRGFRERFDVGMANLLHQMQEVEVKRLKGIGSVLSQYMTVQQGMLGSVSANVEDVVGAITASHPQKDVAHFIALHRTGAVPSPLPEYVMPEAHPLSQSQSSSGASKATPLPPASSSTPSSSSSSSSTGHLSAQLLASAGADNKEDRHSDNSSNGSSAGSFVVVEDDSKTAASDVKASTHQAQLYVAEHLRRMLEAVGCPTAWVCGVIQRFDPSSIARVRATADKDLQSRLLSLFESPDGRVAFASVLNQARNSDSPDSLQLNAEGFQALGKLILQFLDYAEKAMHVRPVQLTMIMSQTFFHVPPSAADSATQDLDDLEKQLELELGMDVADASAIGSVHGARIYLQNVIKKHPIWRSRRFWEEAFYDSYTQELKKHAQLQKWHSDVEQAEAEHRQKNVLFAQLGAFAHNMTEFDMDAGETRDFITRMCRIHELNNEHMEMLLHMPCLQVPTKSATQ